MHFDRLVPLLTAAATDGRLSDAVVETGIKVIDVMCPIRAAGCVAIASENGAGGTGGHGGDSSAASATVGTR